jgi:hypothetical protein
MERVVTIAWTCLGRCQTSWLARRTGTGACLTYTSKLTGEMGKGRPNRPSVVPDRQGTCCVSGCNFDHLMSGKQQKQSKLQQGCGRSRGHLRSGCRNFRRGQGNTSGASTPSFLTYENDAAVWLTDNVEWSSTRLATF